MVLMIVVTAGAAICFPAIKLGLISSPPIKFAGFRTLFAGLALLAAAPLMQERVWLPKRLWLWLIPLGLTATTLTFGSMFLSPEFTTTSVASVLGNLQPLAVIVFGAAFLGERITRWKLAALALGLAGVTLIAVRPCGSPGSNGSIGATLALLSSVSAAGSSIMFKKLRPGKDLLALIGWQMVVASVPLFCLAFLFERHLPVKWSVQFISVLLTLALIGSALTTIIWAWLLQKYEAGSLSVYLFLTPVFALGAAYAAFREPLNPLELSGTAFILASVAAEHLHSKPPAQ
jgi:drug/metabolite transporter (DMT)-like permease